MGYGPWLCADIRGTRGYALSGVTGLTVLLGFCFGCASTHVPRLEYRELWSQAVGERLEYAVYQPRARKPDERLPLVVFLHGAGDGPASFDDAGIGERLDRAIEGGRVPRVVIALPEGGLSFWENEAHGSRRYRDWVLDEVMPKVAAEYHTASCPDGCHIMGNSMGGYGAMRFVYEVPGRFVSVTALSAPIFDTQQMLDFRDSFWWGLIVPIDRIWGDSNEPALVAKDDVFLHWHRRPDLLRLRFMLAWGTHDHAGIIENNQRFTRHLQKRGVRHRAYEFQGEHDWQAWGPVIERALAEQVPSPKRPAPALP